MCVAGTPVTHHPDLGLWIKHEEQCCPGGPNFSKTRGVYAHVKARPEDVIGVLDTHHSQGGWAVARACQLLGKDCVDFYPVRKGDRDSPAISGIKGSWGDVLRPQQEAAERLGATLVPLAAGRSAVLYHTAKRLLTSSEDYPAGTSYMMPNALKLPEMVSETAAEVSHTELPPVGVILISASSATIAAGVIRGLLHVGWGGKVVLHQGYSRPSGAMLKYVNTMAALPGVVEMVGDVVDERYAYGDECRKPYPELPCPMNTYYDRKAFAWWCRQGRSQYGEALLWNIG